MPSLPPDTMQVLEALDASKLRSEPFFEHLTRLGFEFADPKSGVLRFRADRGIVALWCGLEGTIATCVLFPESHHFTVGTTILMRSALSTDDPRLNATGVVLAAAGVSRSGLALAANLVQALREEAQASAQRSVRDRVIEVVANQCGLTDVAEETQLTDYWDELDFLEIVLSLEDVYGAIEALEDWDPFSSSEVTTVGDLIALVEPEIQGKG